MKTSTEIIKERRSIYPRMFSDAPVQRDELEKALETARWAPTHKLTQPWRFQVFMGESKEPLLHVLEAWTKARPTTPEVIQKKITKLHDNFRVSGAVIAIVMKRDDGERIPYFEELSATACAVQNFWLSLKSFGLAGYWSTGSGTNSEEVRAFLEIEEKDEHLGWFYIGKTEVELPEPQNRKGVEEYVIWR